jgi:hypothetical protein
VRALISASISVGWQVWRRNAILFPPFENEGIYKKAAAQAFDVLVECLPKFV